ncbi:MAG: formylmethanofuran--tetrahydromethanopterin N-formyltransferase [Candidatus Nezhaarchaeota archaeon]|nr:formylmethanofuran--tetrahydromethanopterin N-formyltransferase [Candidatus Nezhaarchaeota archaeon]
MSFKIGDVEIEDTFAEAFPMYATRLLITALNDKWALTAARVATGFATSIIMSPAEAGLERLVPPEKTPDKRVGALIHIYHRSVPELKLQTIVRVGQCILTCPTTALFDGIPRSKRKMHIGEALAKFGDGFEVKDVMYGKTVWRIPVMEGEFIVEDAVGVVKAVAGGNFFILASSHEAALEAAEKAVEEISSKCRNVVLPFPGGIVRSGSKVGSLKYPKLTATTNHLYCPTIRDKVPDTRIPEGVKSVMEIVINGLDVESVTKAVGVGVMAACSVRGVVKITAGNYGGKLGPYKIYLKDAVELAKSS